MSSKLVAYFRRVFRRKRSGTSLPGSKCNKCGAPLRDVPGRSTRHVILRSTSSSELDLDNEEGTGEDGSCSTGAVIDPPVRLDSLPNELLVHILSYVPDDSSLSSVRMTCWRLHDLIGDPKVWNKSRLVLRDSLNWVVMTRVMLRATSMPLAVLDVAGCVSVTDHLLAAIVLAHPELRCLDLSGCLLVSDFGLTALRCLESLQELKVARCCLVTCNGVLGAIETHSASLRLLDISECLGLSSDPYRLARFAEFCRHLTHLSMGWPRSAVGLNPVLDHDLIKFASMCHQLTHLNLTCGRLSDSSLEAVTRYCESLTHLNLSHSGIRDSGLGMIAFHLQELTALDLSECSHVSDSGVGTIAASLHKIQSLYLAHCFHVTDKGAERLLRHLPHLRDLRLGGCFRVTDAGVENASTFPRSLCYMDLSGTMVSQDGIETIRQHGNAALVIITNNCPFVEFPKLPGNLSSVTTRLTMDGQTFRFSHPPS